MEDEVFIKGNEIDRKSSESNVLDSTVNIEIDSSKLGSGFFIQFKKNNGKTFYCLMTNEHVITPEIIKAKKKIKISYKKKKKI